MLTKRNFSVNRQEIHFKYSKVKFPFRHSSLSMADLRLLQAKRFSFVAPNKQVQVAFNTRRISTVFVFRWRQSDCNRWNCGGQLVTISGIHCKVNESLKRCLMTYLFPKEANNIVLEVYWTWQILAVNKPDCWLNFQIRKWFKTKPYQPLIARWTKGQVERRESASPLTQTLSARRRKPTFATSVSFGIGTREDEGTARRKRLS